jgi:hypothetical protein
MKRTLVLSTLLAMALLLTFGLSVTGYGSTPSAGGEVQPYGAVGSNDDVGIIWHTPYGGGKFRQGNSTCFSLPFYICFFHSSRLISCHSSEGLLFLKREYISFSTIFLIYFIFNCFI